MIEILHHFNQARFMGFVPEIRKNLADWQLVEVSLTQKTSHNVAFIARRLSEHFAARDGILFICNSRQILGIVRMGPVSDTAKLAAGITASLPQYSCTVEAGDITADGLLRLQVRLQDLSEDGKAGTNPLPALLDARQRRVGRVVMVADDDMFMRSLVVNTFKPKASVIEHGDAGGVVDTYLEHLPDVLFLDIHLPGGSGIDILAEVLKFDSSAYVIMLTSDSVKENVISAKKAGAKGFIAKPFTRQKLEECYNASPSVAPWLAAKK